MSLGGFCWVVFLAGLPLAPLLERRLDLWHMQGLWTALWMGVLFGLSLFTKEKKSTFGNKPLAAWLIFTWVWVLWVFTQGIISDKKYNMILFMPTLHILSIILFYISASTFWSRSFIEHLLKVLAISSSIMVIYGLSQALNFDPLFKDLNVSTQSTHEIVGMVGNPSHFGVYLALILPLFWLYKHPTSYAIQAGIWSLFALLVVKNASVSGLICAIIASFTWWLFKKRNIAILVMILAFIAMSVLLFNHEMFQKIVSDQGRLKAWGEFSKLIAKDPLFGIGPGAISFMSNSFTGFMTSWRHCHNELLQITIEQGLVGLSIAFWFVYDTFKRIIKIGKDNLTPVLASVCSAFLAASFVGFPAHLWMLGSVGLFAICAINVLSETA